MITITAGCNSSFTLGLTIEIWHQIMETVFSFLRLFFPRLPLETDDVEPETTLHTGHSNLDVRKYPVYWNDEAKDKHAIAQVIFQLIEKLSDTIRDRSFTYHLSPKPANFFHLTLETKQKL